MERGSIDPAKEFPATVFVFDGLIAQLRHPRFFWAAKRMGRWERSLEAWAFDQMVLASMERLIDAYHVPLRVLTWQPVPFAQVLHARLYDIGVPVRSTESGTYESFSPRLAVDTDVATVYDPDNRFGYGFKAREFSLERF
jgi:hypothetical protein